MVSPLRPLALLLGLSACIDVFPVSPPAEQQTVLHLSLRLSDLAEAGAGDGALVTVTATLDTGVDEIGRTRGIQNDTLIVFAEPVPAVDIGVGSLLVGRLTVAGEA